MTDRKQTAKAAFEQYVSAYNAEDPKIRLKIDHSYRVAELCERIARSVMGCDAPAFAWVLGLLHDIGRFEQVRRYGTFSDADSVDHAQLGADQLLHEGLLEEFGLALTAEERHLMELAVRWHSAYRVPAGLTARERAWCDVLRDADKVDIFRVLCDTPPEEIYDVTTEELRSAAVTDAVKECFFNRTAVLREKRRTPIDKIVGHICLTFELVYPESRRIAQAQGYVDRLLAFESENEETARWFAYMREHVWR